ncbi:hypothetical protein E4U54_008091 [Claviceps lovelessii]|nr:hypothetical protein E4U54_008091 [Claviceps lovelessii]
MHIHARASSGSFGSSRSCSARLAEVEDQDSGRARVMAELHMNMRNPNLTQTVTRGRSNNPVSDDEAERRTQSELK